MVMKKIPFNIQCFKLEHCKISDESITNLLFRKPLDRQQSPAFRMLEKHHLHILKEDKAKRHKKDSSKGRTKEKRVKKLNEETLNKMVNRAKNLFLFCFNGGCPNSEKVTIDVEEARGSVDLCLGEVRYDVVPMPEGGFAKFDTLSGSGNSGNSGKSASNGGFANKIVRVGTRRNDVAGEGMVETTVTSWCTLSTNVKGGFDQNALRELRVLRALWDANKDAPDSLWLPEGVHSHGLNAQHTNSSPITTKNTMAALTNLSAPVWFFGPPVRFRLKTLIDNKRLFKIHPIHFLHGILSALRHCHSSKIVLGKSVLSTSSIYIDAQFRPVIVDLSSAQYASHSNIAKQLEKEIKEKRRNSGIDAVAASKRADQRMKARDLAYMPIETMLGSTVATMPCDVSSFS